VLTVTAESAVEQFKTRTIDKLRDVRCPVHHQPPRIRFEGSTLRDVRISMSACCARLSHIANQAIAAPEPGPRR
jgi:hypothetical protein